MRIRVRYGAGRGRGDIFREIPAPFGASGRFSPAIFNGDRLENVRGRGQAGNPKKTHPRLGPFRGAGRGTGLRTRVFRSPLTSASENFHGLDFGRKQGRRTEGKTLDYKAGTVPRYKPLELQVRVPLLARSSTFFFFFCLAQAQINDSEGVS